MSGICTTLQAQTMLSGASAEAIQHHYDLSDEFYALWLDPTMTYSCALWDGESDTLEAAQCRKLDWIAQQALVGGARRVLDIGCGWGALLERLVSTWGVAAGMGLTLSASQQRHVAAKRLPGVEVRLESWAEHQAGTAYDAIVSVGAFEHFARPGMSIEERQSAYRQFFSTCRSMLPVGAPLVLQTIAYGSGAGATAAGQAFFGEVFPESECPRLSEIVAAAEGLFELVVLRNDRPHYTRTLNAWLRNLKSHHARAVALVGSETVDFYKRYLRISAIGFHTKQRALLRMAWARL